MGTGLYSLVAGLCFLLTFVLYLRMISSVVRSEKRDIYVGIMIVGMVYLGLDVLWGVIYDNLLPIPIPIQEIIYAAYYASSATISYRWFVYVEYMQESALYHNPKIRRLTKIPMMFVVIVSVLSLWTHSFFYIDAQGAYCRGPLYIAQLVFTYGYIVFAAGKLALRMFMTKNFEDQNTYMIMLSYFVFPVVFGILQIVYQNMPFLCMGIAMATLQTYLFYVTFERERELSSSKIHSLSRLFISSYYLDLQTGKREYLSNTEEKVEDYLTGDFYREAPADHEDAIRVYADSFIHKDDRENYCTMCSRAYMAKKLSKDNLFYSFNYRQIAGGVEKWYRMHVIVASYAPDGKITHVVLAIMDVDKEIQKDIQQKEALEKALVDAEQANKAKSRFLSNMSHDIRTPMNAITGFANLAQTYIEDKAQVKDYLGKIQSASKHLLNLINDILDMSRIESGKVQIEESEVSLREVLTEVNNLIQPMAEEKNIDFQIQNEIVNNYVYCDKLRLNQVLINLLGNSVKFTPNGGEISLRIHQEMVAPAGYGVYIFKVKDNGIGIGKEFQDSIFQAFEREKSTENSGIQGTGLGLSITKSIVTMMGGKISVESELGKGAEFTVKVVFMLQDMDEAEINVEEKRKEIARKQAKEKEAQRELFAGRKLLLVEDNNLNREIAKKLLSEQGFIIDEAVNGKEAVDKVKASHSGEYAVVLMDIQMPIMDGYEATKKIRDLDNRILANVPIVAMTANAFGEERKKAFACGMNGYVTKPIEIDVLFETLKQIIE
ncbi:MAG: response regulator [Agathobacter sp.]|nr:response regulator [Agathobacter sp.]